MRLVGLEGIKEGDIIGRDIVGYDGGVLLKKNSKFKEAFREKLLERNITTIYIDDEISKDIEINPIMDMETMRKITEDVKKEFAKLEKVTEINCELLEQVADEIISGLSSRDVALEIMDLKVNDTYTYEHCISVALLTAVVCRKMNLRQDIVHRIVLGALLHDIGKIIMPKNCLNKPGALTTEEYDMIKAHVEIGYSMIKENDKISPITKLIVLCHHEREDGTGYPLGKGEEIHVGVKIVAACDVFHALFSDRPYRIGMDISQAITVARREKLNPEIRAIIEETLAFYPVGSAVILSNGDIALVEKNYRQDVKRPLVKVIYNYNSKMKLNYKINLQEHEELYILKKLEDIPRIY
ncbi:hypothetical protein CS063_00605 [Sporanaerobium hydrogeniformans]|uniref:Uncharacterized protein n=1 Tax=Sporanaerobium hydrogeniformans TaxID=3072179 RepID=A0AC61DGM4_9FIRM|nr:HD-GYP domain-containing protein [Sporanaerobium hydrogeniformans]PHV72010.1 hypothetical protein CS063_00605 [Sporanaerobium hydrogeniformans]